MRQGRQFRKFKERRVIVDNQRSFDILDLSENTQIIRAAALDQQIAEDARHVGRLRLPHLLSRYALLLRSFARSEDRKTECAACVHGP